MDVDRISDTFRGQVLFLTGATGFMGKVFLERLLRVTEVRKIFVLIRPKRDKNSNERLLEILDNPLFDKLKTLMSLTEILAKVQPINGDCSHADLSISPADRSAITSQSMMFFHFAATVRFNEKFKRAIELNVRGTREMVKLALECKHLRVFCHVSTAFCHLEEQHLNEQIYEAVADPHAVIEIAEKFNEDEVEAKLSSYLCDHVPNTYVFTKGLSETIVARAHEEHGLPVLIARPAIIMSAFKDPIAGWTDNLYNISGALAAGGLGILRTFLAKKDAVLNITCVDYAVANVIASVSHYLNERPSSLLVVNLEYMAVSLVDQFNKSLESSRETPFDFVLWYPNVHFTESLLVFYFNMILFQWIPSLLIDLLLILFGRKPVLTRAQKKLFIESKIVRIFQDNKWTFDQTNISKIYALMNETEMNEYGTRNRDKNDFHRNNSHGLRRFVFKQSDEKLESARFRMKIIYIIDRAVRAYFFYSIVRSFWIMLM